MNNALETGFTDFNLIKRGKVRDIYAIGDALLLVATDRISAFDVVMPNPIPDKGKVLTRLSQFWFDRMRHLVDNHVIATDVDEFPAECRLHADALRDRSMLVKKSQPLPIECVVRGYLSGSGWKSYQRTGRVCGIELPAGLQESDRLPQPIFTPSTKAEQGQHDINISFDEAVELVGAETAEKVKTLSLAIYQAGAETAAHKGIIIADTKFEFGYHDGRLLLIDEILTPDSSRFWPKSSYRPGGPQLSYDKQYLRDYLTSIGWDKTPPAPNLPDDVVQNTRRKYMEALEQLTGSAHAF